MAKDINMEEYPDMTPDDRVYIIFNRLYDYITSYNERFRKIMTVNSIDGALARSFSLFVKQQTAMIMMECPYVESNEIPYELMAEHYSNTIQLIIEWCFLRRKITSREDAEKCLRYLLENIK